MADEAKHASKNYLAQGLAAARRGFERSSDVSPDIVVRTSEGALLGQVKSLSGGQSTKEAIVVFLDKMAPLEFDPAAARRR